MGVKGERRRARQAELAREMLKHVPHDLDGVLQVGLGDWAEGPALLEWAFPGERLREQKFLLAVEPVKRYRVEARAAGFYGDIHDGIAWDVSGQDYTFGDNRSKTSIFSDRAARGLGQITSRTITLDDLFEQYIVAGAREARVRPEAMPSHWLLWLDCEGAEPHVLRGAANFLPRVQAVILELKDEPNKEWWWPTERLVGLMDELGFDMVYRCQVTEQTKGDGVFVRR